MIEETNWREKLSGYAGHDRSTLIAICDAFLEEVPILIRQIRSEIEHPSDGDKLRIAAHTLKSCFRYVAPEQDVERAATMEQLASTPQLIKPEQLEQLEAAANHWCQSVRQFSEEASQGGKTQ